MNMDGQIKTMDKIEILDKAKVKDTITSFVKIENMDKIEITDKIKNH